MKHDVAPTAEIIMMMASRFRDSAKELDRIAEQMLKRNDLSYASEAFMTAFNTLQNSRLDLLITRPIRSLEQSY